MLTITVEITGTDAGYTGRDVREIMARVTHEVMRDEMAGMFTDGADLSVKWHATQAADPSEHDCGTCSGEHEWKWDGIGTQPQCACGWTPHRGYTVADHLAEMG